MEDTEAKETELVIEPNADVELEGINQRALKMKSAGYSFMYDPETGERSIVNNNMFTFNLKKKKADGSPRFVKDKPKNPPHPIEKGTFKCFLHKDDPNRAKYDAMGFPTCPKDDLASAYQAQRHAEKRHKSEWGAIKYERERQEREEDRAIQRAILANMGGKTPEKKEPTGEFTCDVCGKVCASEFGLKAHKRSHK